MKIYVASSWRNERQPLVVEYLRSIGHEVYDFKNAGPEDKGFHWSEIESDWKDWDCSRYLEGLAHPLADQGFKSDFDAMEWADTCVLVLPSGRSSHLEGGWFPGNGRRLVILLNPDEPIEPELMYKMADFVAADLSEVGAWLREQPAPGYTIEPSEKYSGYWNVYNARDSLVHAAASKPLAIEWASKQGQEGAPQ